MTKSEKRNFKLFTGKSRFQDGKDYLRLFDALEEMDKYDEKVILEKFKNEPYFKHLRSVKFYLYHQIIKSLKNIHDESSSSIKLHNYLIEIQIFYKKGLFKNCANTIKIAKAFALKYENFHQLLELINWEYKITLWNKDVRNLEALKQKWKEEEKDALEKYDEIYQLRQLTQETQLFFLQKGPAKTKQELQSIQHILSNELLTVKKKSFTGEAIRLSIVYNSLLILGRIEERYLILKDLIDIFDQYVHWIDEHLNEYFYNLRILANLAIRLKKFTYANALMEKMDLVYETKYSSLDFINKLGHLSIVSDFFLKKGEFNKALSLIPKIDNLVESNKQNLDEVEEIHLHETRALIFFCNGAFKDAQYYIQKIISSGADLRLDMQTTARLFYLILQYEEGEYQHLDYAWRSTYRYLRKKQRLQKAEIIVLQFLKAAANFKSKKQVLHALAKFKESIAPYTDQFMVEFPVIEWIESKIQNKSMSEIIQKNYLEHQKEDKKLH